MHWRDTEGVSSDVCRAFPPAAHVKDGVRGRAAQAGQWGWSTSSARRPNATVSGVEFIRMAVQVAPAEPGHMGEDLCRDRVDECPPPKVRGGWVVVVAGRPHLHLCCSEDKLGSSAGLYSEQPKQIQQLPCNEPEINICSRPFMVNPFISVSSDGFSLTECYNIQIKAYFVTSAGDCVWLRQLY